MLVQRGEITLTATSTFVTLETPVPVGKSFPMVLTRHATSSRMNTAVTPVLTTEVNGYFTQILFQRASNNYDVTLVYYIISGDEFTVQSDLYTLQSGYTSRNVTIGEVDLTKTFVLSYTRQATSDVTYNDSIFRIRVSLTNATTLNFSRSGTGHTVNNAWYVVTMEGATVEQFTANIPTSGYATDVSVNEVDISKAFLIHTWQSDFIGAFPSASVIAHFIDNSTIRCRLNNTPAITVTGFVVSHPKIKVISGLTAIDSGVSTAQEYVPVDTDISFAVINTATGTSNNTLVSPAIHCTAILDSGNINFQRNHTGSDCELAWFAIEWKPVLIPASLRPNNVAIMPDESNIFRWTKDTSMIVTAYEIGWRDIGGEWQDSGKIDSNVQYHEFLPGTFELGKDYEWRVRHWDCEQYDPSDWVIASINTYRPVILNPIPEPDSSIRVEIRNLGGNLKSPYGRDVQLNIEIADNPEFSNPTAYVLPAVSSGEIAMVQHAMQHAGYWHVRMTATDSEGVQTLLEYRIFVSHRLFFKEYPNVKIQAPRATHVTARVRGTSIEYTAVVMPPPSPETRIERLVIIDSGTQATCQAVAVKLLEKWGRPQVSIQGVISLTLVLRSRQKVRIVIPEMGLNEDMILQSRRHVIDGDQAYTQISLGDIQLSESELISRTIDSLQRAAQAEAYLAQTAIQTLGIELSEQEINNIEQGQELSDTDIQVIEMGGEDAVE